MSSTDWQTRINDSEISRNKQWTNTQMFSQFLGWYMKPRFHMVFSNLELK